MRSHARTLVFLPVTALAAALAVSACNTEPAKQEHARQEIGIQSGVLMTKSDVPKDQADYDKLTVAAGCPTDPWGNPYAYERLGTRKIRISSKGKDGKLGTSDDVAAEFTFPSGSGLESLTIKRADGSGTAITSPDGSKSFWITQTDSPNGDDQTIEYFIGDAKGAATKPVRSQKITDWKRSVTIVKWSRDGKFLVAKDIDASSRPDGQKTREVPIAYDTHAGTMLANTAGFPADASAWVEY